MRSACAKVASAILLWALVVCGTGCSTFNRDWHAAGARSAAPNSLEGRWDGEWHSDANGHHGKLRCLLTRMGDGEYRARFHATFSGIFRVNYTVVLTVVEKAPESELRGEARLGWWRGGTYHYDGRVTAGSFFAKYACAYDHGTFEMKRPE